MDIIEQQVYKEMDQDPWHKEGKENKEWILLDYGDFVVHVFEQIARKFYDLDRLWRESKRVELPPALRAETSSLRKES